MQKQEREILKILRSDSRASLTRIARELDLDIREVYNKIKQLENSLIIKYSTLIDFEKLGYPIIINYFFIPESKIEDKLLQGFLLNHLQVNNLYKTEAGYISELIFRDMKEFSEFNELLEKFKFKQKKFHPVIKEIKREGFLF